MIGPLQAESGGPPLAAAAFTVGLVAVHLIGGRWHVSDPTRRQRWLSAAGGASVAYVFVLLLPEVSEAALFVGERRGEALVAEQTVYLLALAGFVASYGVEAFVTHRLDSDVESSPLVFWGHVGLFCLYSGLIAYLLFHQEAPGVLNQFFYALAMALHFSVTDYGLSRHHGAAFDRVARWLLAGATVLGGVVGVLVEIDGLPLSMLFGFLAGAIVLNVVKEELPTLDQSRFAAFAAGAGLYVLVLLLT